MLIVTEYDKHYRGTGKNTAFKDQNAARIFCESKGRGSWLLNNQYYEVRQGGGKNKILYHFSRHLEALPNTTAWGL